MQKVEGVDKVTVSLKDGLTVLELKSGNTVTLANLRSIIKNNGFVSRNAEIVATGSLAATGDFDVAGTRERLPVAGKAIVDAQNNWRLTSPGK
jgi:hypothetical protein